MTRALLLSTVLLSACFVVPANQGGGTQPAGGGGGDPYAGGGGGGEPAAGGGGAPAPAPPAGPIVVSVSLKNTCPKTVRLFFGDKPKFGSGRYTTLGSNTITSESMQEGDMIWIVDESENGLSSTSVSQGGRNLEILPSCTGFTVR